MDASELTRRRKIRTEYVNNIYRKNAIAAGLTNKPATSGNQIGDKNGVDYTHWKNYITLGPTYISQAELDAIFMPAEPPIVYNETFAVFAKNDSQPNWFYRFYNATTNLWSNLIDTGYPHATWTNDNTASEVNYFCIAFYNIETTAVDFLFIDINGQLTNTISMPDNAFVYNFTRNYLFIKGDGTLRIYNPLTQALQTATLAIDSHTILDNGVFLQGVQDGSHASYYMWPLGSTVAPVLIVNHIVGRGIFGDYDEHNDINILITCSGATYLDTVYLIFSNGTFTSYNLPTDTYIDVNTDFYGINNKFTLLKFTAEDNSVTYNTFPNVLGTITPRSITLTDPTYYTEFYSSNYDPAPTFQSNHLVIANYTSTTNISYIATGGDIFSNSYEGGPFVDVSGGNQMKLSAGQIVYDPDARIQPDFIMDCAIYGSYKKYTDESGHIAGYVVGSDISGNPHTSIVYTERGVAQIGITGAYAYNISPNPVRNQDTYNAGSGVEGTWWSIVRECTGDGPTNCEVWFTMENTTDWSTNVDEFIDLRQEDGNRYYQSSIDVSGTNFVLGKVMLAATMNTDISNAQITNYLEAYVADAIPHLFTDPADFTTISGEAFKTWHDLSGAQYWNYITDPYIYTYDGIPMPPPQFSEGTAYVSINGENFQTIEYTGPNLLSKHITLNETAVMIIEGNVSTDKQSSRLFTSTDPSGTAVDLSGNLPTNPYAILDIIGFPYLLPTQSNFIYINTETLPIFDPNWFPVGTSYYVMNNSNEQIYNEQYSTVIIFPFCCCGSGGISGNNFVAIGISLVSIYLFGPCGDVEPAYMFIVRNSVLTKYTDYIVDELYGNNYDIASGVIFGYLDNEDDTSTILTISNTNISGTTIELPYSNLDKYQTADHFILLAGDDLRIRIWDSTGTLYSYTPTTPISIYTNESRVRSTSTKICFFLKIDPTDAWLYVIFDLVTHTYTSSMTQNIEPSSFDWISRAVNYPYSIT